MGHAAFDPQATGCGRRCVLNPPCPVCGGVVHLDYRDTLDHGTVCESQEHCDACGWSYTFAYGNSTEVIGEEEIHWTWTETPEQRDERRAVWADAVNKRRGELLA